MEECVPGKAKRKSIREMNLLKQMKLKEEKPTQLAECISEKSVGNQSKYFHSLLFCISVKSKR